LHDFSVTEGPVVVAGLERSGLRCLITHQPAGANARGAAFAMRAWLRLSGISLYSKGFVLTGTKRSAMTRTLSFETNIDGVFAIGDVRLGSMKRVAAAVGEGAAVVAQVHGFLAAHADSS
jgi:hypothetical protein